MYLIVGLGNPEEEYSNTRHNMGFDTINKIAKQYNIEVNKNKFKGLCGSGIIENKKAVAHDFFMPHPAAPEGGFGFPLI